jgi:hypothetical protein
MIKKRFSVLKDLKLINENFRKLRIQYCQESKMDASFMKRIIEEQVNWDDKMFLLNTVKIK